MKFAGKKYQSLFLALGAASLLAACAGEDGLKTEAKYPTGADRAATGSDNIYAEPDSIFGADGLNIFGGGKDRVEEDSGIGINSYLWRAALDTVSFMPLASADPFGGVILTDWYTPAENADERLKLNVFIMGRQLRSDAVRVRAFKQVAGKHGWVNAEVSAETERKLEDTILTRARQMRVAEIN